MKTHETLEKSICKKKILLKGSSALENSGSRMATL